MSGNTISRVARLAGVGVETVRYYQRRGLVSQPPKPESGYRQYPDETVERIRFIKRAQELGFTLAEISSLLELGDGSCSQTEALARRKLAKIDSRLQDLQALRRVLEDLVLACQRNRDESGCPIIGALTTPSREGP